MASKVPKGLGSVAITPGYNVGIKLGYCSSTAIRTTFTTISAPGTKPRSAPAAVDTTTRNTRPNSQKRVSLATPKVSKSDNPPLTPCGQGTARSPEEESERLRSRGSILEVSRHLPQNFVHRGSKEGGRRFAKHDGTLERSPGGGTPIRALTWLSAGLHGCVAQHDNT